MSDLDTHLWVLPFPNPTFRREAGHTIQKGVLDEERARHWLREGVEAYAYSLFYMIGSGQEPEACGYLAQDLGTMTRAAFHVVESGESLSLERHVGTEDEVAKLLRAAAYVGDDRPYTLDKVVLPELTADLVARLEAPSNLRVQEMREEASAPQEPA